MTDEHASSGPWRFRSASKNHLYEIITSDVHGGVIKCAPFVAVPEGAHLVLVSQDRGFGPIQLFIQVTERTLSHNGMAATLHFDWVMITACERRRFLLSALKVLVGIDAHLRGDDDRLGPDRKLVYYAASRQVRMLGIAAHTKPRGGQRIATDRQHPSKRHSRVLVDTSPDTTPRTRSNASTLRVLDQTPIRPPTPRVTPMFRREDADGFYVVDGRREQMVCRWVGHSRLCFVTGSRLPRPGTVIQLGIPADPVTTGHLRLKGVARRSRLEGTTGRTLIEVELLERPTSTYRSLVEHWRRAS